MLFQVRKGGIIAHNDELKSLHLVSTTDICQREANELDGRSVSIQFICDF